MPIFFIACIILAQPILAQDSPHGMIKWKCVDCHSTEGWAVVATPMNFNHSETAFVLYGQHRNTSCRQCHATLRFRETSNQCVTCHKTDFDHALSVDHQKAGFQTDCTECHHNDAISWRAGFDHTKTNFPTRGIHEAVECSTCHVNGVYRGTPKECVACHLKEYTATTDPKHAASGFPTDCAICHRALTWQPAAFFPHDQYFPIAAGDTHRPGRWRTCYDCHTASPNYAVFECINCHEHAKSSMDSHHKQISGYSYQSQACYRCHPQGDAG